MSQVKIRALTGDANDEWSQADITGTEITGTKRGLDTVIGNTSLNPIPITSTSIENSLTSILSAVDTLEANTDGIESSLTTINTTLTKNTRIKILEATDVVKTATYTLTGGNYRLDRFDYTAASVPGFTAREAFTWSDFGTKDERIATITWSII